MGYLLARLLGNFFEDNTFLKASVVFAILGIVVGWGVWSRHQPLESGSFTLQPGEMRGRGIELNRDSKLAAEFTPAPGAKGTYTVMILSFYEQLQLPTSKLSDIQGKARATGSGPLKLGPVDVDHGQYSVVAINTGDQPLTLSFKINAKRQSP